MKVWIGLILLTVIEAVLAYVQLTPLLMLSLLLGFSLVKAVMIMAYFMHLKFDRPALSWMLVPPLVACIVVLALYVLPDGLRALEFRP